MRVMHAVVALGCHSLRRVVVFRRGGFAGKHDGGFLHFREPSNGRLRRHAVLLVLVLVLLALLRRRLWVIVIAWKLPVTALALPVLVVIVLVYRIVAPRGHSTCNYSSPE